ncbi:MAG TPA: AgmX/PglI C-terminal domain-containing protein, partial [Polyangiales bacterium]|nr:AgmX/PglI C-terminal domain-containing protein [Polyangiales bacterium]
VSVKFMIAPTGAVQTSVIQSSDLGSPAAESCIAQAVRRWSFPAPEGGGVVVVSYPFLLSQTGS